MASGKNKLTVVVGKTGCGKSTWAKQRALEYVEKYPNRLAIIIDPHSTFQVNHPRILVFTFDLGLRASTAQRMDFIIDIAERYTNCLMIWDDCKMYTESHDTFLVNLNAGKRHKKQDHIFIYHTTMQIQLQIISAADYLVFFKINEAYEKVKKRIDNFEFTQSLYKSIVTQQIGQCKVIDVAKIQEAQIKV
jgi:energy-coupling factor transporter ATP-binding protein EcfA2